MKAAARSTTPNKGGAPSRPRRRPQAAPAPSLPTQLPPVELALPAPPWAALYDDELLAMRIGDLHVRIEGSELAPRVAQLHAELAALGLRFAPPCYLGDEWFTPAGMALIALPFYLAHPRLRLLERRLMREVEGGTDEECMQLLRHECGHAFDHAYRFSRRPRWRALFGASDSNATPDVYRPRPYSRSFVRHLKNHYAQAHPDEDFAETFAVVLGTPAAEWRKRYRGWKALEKLEYVASLVAEAAKKPVPRTPVERVSEARRIKKTLRRYYAERRKAYAEDFPDFLDRDLLHLFGEAPSPLPGAPQTESAARFLRRRRDPIVTAVVGYTGAHKYTVDALLRRLIVRCETLGLAIARDEPRTLLELGAYLASLVTTHLHTGRYKRTV
jgi:hypothetical protein